MNGKARAPRGMVTNQHVRRDHKRSVDGGCIARNAPNPPFRCVVTHSLRPADSGPNTCATDRSGFDGRSAGRPACVTDQSGLGYIEHGSSSIRAKTKAASGRAAEDGAGTCGSASFCNR